MNGDLYAQKHRGCYGDKDWLGQPEGWTRANCKRLVKHAVGEMNDLSRNDNVLDIVLESLAVTPKRRIETSVLETVLQRRME